MGKVNEMKAAMENNKENANRLYQESEKNYLEARLLGEDDRFSTLLQDVYLGLGSLYLKRNKISDSKSYLDKAFQMFKGIKKDLRGLFKIQYLHSYMAIIRLEDHKMYMQYLVQTRQVAFEKQPSYRINLNMTKKKHSQKQNRKRKMQKQSE
jgi:hypothetical protein